jgi:hypothetical protein
MTLASNPTAGKYLAIISSNTTNAYIDASAEL